MTTRYCCPECFGDRELQDNIFPFLGPIKGSCSFCGTKDVSLIEPSKLSDWFESLVNSYEPEKDGRLLVEWMKEDWELFSHHQMDIHRAKDLLAEILDNGEIVRRRFVPSRSHFGEALTKWDALRDEMMHKNRWFIKSPVDLSRLEQLLDHLIVSELPTLWYRARICADDEMLTIKNMGSPPKRRATNGRANPAGIPYLYLSSKPETAVAEIRPHTGERACVADFTIPKIRAVDLRSPRKLVSPFILTDASEIVQLRADIPFLERLGEELTRPVLPSSAAIDYIPSQYLCEFIKTKGFDGVVYRSSVSDGINLALFDPEKAVGGSTSLYDITRVSVEVKRN